MRLLRRNALIFGREDADGHRIVYVQQAIVSRLGDLRALRFVRVLEAQHHKVGAVAEKVRAVVCSRARCSQRDGLQHRPRRTVDDDGGVSVLPAVGMAGGRDEDVAVLQIDDGRRIVVRKAVMLGGDRRRDMLQLPVIKECVLKGEDARGIVLHLVQRRARKPGLFVQRLIVLVRPALFGERLRQIDPGIRRGPAHRQVHDRIGDQHKTNHDR